MARLTPVAVLLLLAFVFNVVNAADDYTPEALADEVLNLPGSAGLDIDFRQFSGYLDVSETKHMHYWFTESLNDPVKDPLAFWTNGGPGCSGLLGFLTEQGSFRVNKDLSLKLNPHAWNKVANMVYIEAPCGVGFSYSDDPDNGDYKHDDASTAADNYKMIQAFLERFPRYRSNDLYLTSESYGGHYLPTLSKEIVDRNTEGLNPLINFKGFAVGNPATTFYSAIPAGLDTYWGHQLIDKPLYDSYSRDCITAQHKNFTMCEAHFMQIYRAVGDINPYAMDYPVCLEEDGRAKHGRNQRFALLNHMIAGLREEFEGVTDEAINRIKSSMLRLDADSDYEPCADNYMEQYLNTPEVKAAIHVKSDVKWQDCSRSIRYNERDGAKSMTPIYQYLIDGGYGLNILVYSGDNDDVCATIGTQSWIWDLGYNVAGRKWQSYKVDDQVAGYITKWKNTKLAFATVRGAGHEVPTYKPEIALHLFTEYLKGSLTNA